MLEAYEIGISLALQDGVSAGIALIRRDLDALDRAIAATSQNLSRLQVQAGTAAPLRASLPSPPKPPSQVARAAPGPEPQTTPEAPAAVREVPATPAPRPPLPEIVIRAEPVTTSTAAASAAPPSASTTQKLFPSEVQAAIRTPIPTIRDAPQASRVVAQPVGLQTAVPATLPPTQLPALPAVPAQPSVPPTKPAARAIVGLPPGESPAAPPSPVAPSPPTGSPFSHRTATSPATQPATRSAAPNSVEQAYLPRPPRPHHIGQNHHAPNRPAHKAEPVLLRPGPLSASTAPTPAFATPPSALNQLQSTIPMRPAAPTAPQFAPEPGRQAKQAGVGSGLWV